MAIRKMLILVAGHGGGDPGAQGQGTVEANETINIVDKVYDILAPHPDILVEKVPHNLDYVASTNWINANYKNLDDGVIVEVHKNSFGAPATGIETFTGIGPDSLTARLATLVNNGQVETTGLRNRGIKQGGFYLITNSNQRAVLTESGFVSNGGDPVGEAANKKYAQGIANGVCDFFGIARPNVTPPPVITTKEVTDVVVIPFERTQKQDPELPAGQTVVSQVGVNGSTITVWTVTYTNGVETSRVVKSKITKEAVPEVISVGIKQPEPENPLQPETGEDAKSWLQRVFEWILEMLSKFTFKK